MSFFCLFDWFLLQVVATFYLSKATIRNTEVILPKKAAEYLHPYDNCATMIFTPREVFWSSITKAAQGPVVLLEYVHGFRGRGTGSLYVRKFYLHRRNPAHQCWATFAILPEKRGLSTRFMSFTQQPCFIEGNWRFQYFVWMTTVKSKVQQYLTLFHVLEKIGLREVVVVDLNAQKEPGDIRICTT
ncbi:hypothetical protein Fcan01_11111 [Folsomia candida]|uniref:Secreted protein n=1 Tax=Folsomia candida TaxID=158441 RepID=A0A226EA59_FOLCA|nr:hypothetical protein Fcan01_11111 [Folsomia candida]